VKHPYLTTGLPQKQVSVTAASGVRHFDKQSNDRGTAVESKSELVMGHFFKTQPNKKFLDPTQPTTVFTRPNPTHHRHLVCHMRLYRKLYTTTVSQSMKVIIQLQYSLTDSRVFHDVKNITQSSLHPT